MLSDGPFGRSRRGARPRLVVHGEADHVPRHSKETTVGLAILLLILALIIGGVGLFVEALQWLLIIALVLLVIGAIFGARGRRGGAPRA